MKQRIAIRQPAAARRGRRGLATIELLFALPIIVMLCVATIQFGLFFANLEQLSLAVRNGALEASQTAHLDLTTNGDPVPANVIQAVTQQLESSGIEYCAIRLEHNVGGGTTVLETSNGGATETNTPLAAPPAYEYVRVTVCAELSELMPNTGGIFGVRLSNAPATTEFTYVFRYEL